MADYIQTSAYWGNSYWGGSYWGLISTVVFDFAEHYDVNVIMNTTLNFSQVLNTTLAFTGIVNRTLDFTYEELDEL
jgi:hypothetical protein